MPRIVIVGGGFAGLEAARGLRNAPAQVTVVDRSNHHVFQPLLYQVATAALSPADIAAPIRSVLSRQRNAEVLMAQVTGVDLEGKRVILEDSALPYDTLVLATGARHSYFGQDAWEEVAPGLKSIEDATRIRRDLLLAFEYAECSGDPERMRAWLTFVIVGGGPTGTEMAGSIAELAHQVLKRDFRRINPSSARIVLVEAAPRIMGGFDEPLARRAKEDLLRLGVEVQEGVKVLAVTPEGVETTNGFIESGNVIWAAGVQATPVGKWLDAETDRVGRVMVEPDLSVEGRPDVFVVGDAAHVLGPDGQPLLGVAPVAMQQGRYVAKVVSARLEGRREPPAFVYKDKGTLATIGRGRAIARLGRFRITGLLAWLLWVFVHIMYLVGFRNRLLVLLQWAWAYVTWERGARLITPIER